jgi:GcrA cell cycle regulator
MSTRCEGCGQWLPGDLPHTCGEANPQPPKIWPPERVARLLELNAAGMSAADIAVELGCTKAMVVGKLFRELGPKPKPKPPAPPPRPPKPPAPPPAAKEPRGFVAHVALKRIKERQALTDDEALVAANRSAATPLLVDAVPIVPKAKAVDIFHLTNDTCRWPLWPDACTAVTEQRYCGARPIEIGRYCADHSAVAFNKARS